MMLTSNRDAGVSRLSFHIFGDYVVLLVVILVSTSGSSEASAISPWPVPKNEAPEDFSAVIDGKQPFDYAPYLKSVSEPLAEGDLENILDFNDRDLAQEFNFDPMHLLTLLIDKAAVQDTTPEDFFKEMQDLIALQQRSKTKKVDVRQNVISSTEPADTESTTLGSDVISSKKRPLSLTNFNDLFKNQLNEKPTERPETTGSIERTTTLPTSRTTQGMIVEDLDAEFAHLQNKYNICSKCYGQDSITLIRLTLMFPHYKNLGQKPFVNTSYTDVQKVDGVITTTPSDYDSYYTTFRYNDGYLSPRTVQVPSFFTHHEFGGLIPQYGHLDETVRNYIIAMHLYSLYQDEGEKDALVPFRTKCVLVKWRMDKSLVSDDRRVRFLQNNDVLTEDGSLTTEMLNLYSDLVPSSFYSKIFWKIFKQ